MVYIQCSPALCQPFLPNKPHMQTFLTLQSKWEEEICLNNNSAFIGQNSTQFWIIWIIVIQISSAWYFLNSKKEVQLYELPPHTIWEWRTEINKADLVYRITRPFIKHKLKFRMLGPQIIYYMPKCLAK